ncbi:MAG: stage III sporulation protein AB [Lachnospiraceae bacterium]|nr:stage III sporulation protein AB [Lachnospiraceae bacterium]
MLKIAGSICIMLGTSGIGFLYIQKEREKIMFAQMWENIMQMFLSEISYRKQSLAFAGYEIGEKIGGREGECFQRIFERMQQYRGEGFANIWIEEWNLYFKERKLQEEEKKLIEEFAVFTGFEDEVIQIKLVEEQREKWKERKLTIRKGQLERERIVWTISLCAGIVLILVLI